LLLNLLTFFTSKYYSNIKYNHSFAFLLRIFFERSAKIQSTVASLGNVYRNSKWSDLKVQNVKQLHLSSFIMITTTIILTVLFLFYVFLRIDSTSLTSLTSLLFWPFIYILDFTSYIWLCVALLAYNISNKLQLNISSYFYKGIMSKSSFSANLSSSIGYNNPTLKMPSSLSDTSINKNWLVLLHKLYTSKSTLDNSTNSLTLPSLTHNLPSTDNLINIFMKTRANSYVNKLSPSSYTFIKTSNLILKSSSTTNNTIFNNALDLSALNSKNNFILETYNSSINENLNLANQTRWLLKTYPITEKLVSDNFNFTQAKTLLGSTSVNSSTSSNNIWSSNHFTHIKDYDALFLSNNITNLNNFEDSRSWTMKKAYLGLNNSNYSLYFNRSLAKYQSSPSSQNTLLSAYLLDYSLFYNYLSFNSSLTSATPSTYLHKAMLYNSDNTIYQDSFNNYLSSLSSTSLVSSHSYFSFTKVTLLPFKFI
jgi:hypothetical protein